MTNPVPSLPVEIEVAIQDYEDAAVAYGVAEDDSPNEVVADALVDAKLDALRVAILAAFHALAAKAARVDALATALGDAVGRLRSVVDEVRPHVRDGEDARNLREGESFLSSCDALLDAAGGKGGGE